MIFSFALRGGGGEGVLTKLPKTSRTLQNNKSFIRRNN